MKHWLCDDPSEPSETQSLSSVTIFRNILQLWRNLASWAIFEGLFSIWQKFDLFRCMVHFVRWHKGPNIHKYLTNNLAIWSH